MKKPDDLQIALIHVVDALREVNQNQLRRLQILDSQIEALNRLADRQEALEARFEDVLDAFRAVCRVCSQLNILCGHSPKNDTNTQVGNEAELIDRLCQ